MIITPNTKTQTTFDEICNLRTAIEQNRQQFDKLYTKTHRFVTSPENHGLELIGGFLELSKIKSETEQLHTQLKRKLHHYKGSTQSPTLARYPHRETTRAPRAMRKLNF